MTKHNLPDTCVKILGTIGDCNGPENGGGIVWLHEQGHAVLEYANGHIVFNMLTGDEDPLVEVYSTHIDADEDLRQTFDWVDWQGLIDAGWPEGWPTLDEMFGSDDPMDKALIIESIAQYHGWMNIDPYPSFYTESELGCRWYGCELDEEEARLNNLRHTADRYADNSTPHVRRFFETGVIANVDKFLAECEEMREWYRGDGIDMLVDYAREIGEEGN